MAPSLRPCRDLRDGDKLSARHLHELAATTAGEVFVALGMGGRWLFPPMATGALAQEGSLVAAGTNEVDEERGVVKNLCLVTECGWVTRASELAIPRPQGDTQRCVWLCFENWLTGSQSSTRAERGSPPTPRAEWTEGERPQREGPALLLFERSEENLVPVPLPAVIGAHRQTEAAAEELSNAAQTLRKALTPKRAELLGLSGEQLHHLDPLVGALGALPTAPTTGPGGWRETTLVRAFGHLVELSRQVVGWRLHTVALHAAAEGEKPSPAGLCRAMRESEPGTSLAKLQSWCKTAPETGGALKEWFEVLTQQVAGLSQHLGESSSDWADLEIEAKGSGKLGKRRLQFERPSADPFALRIFLHGHVEELVPLTVGGKKIQLRGTPLRDGGRSRYEHVIPAGAIETLSVIIPDVNFQIEWKRS